MGSFPLIGSDRDAWDGKNEGDLIAIKPRAAPDILSKWFTERLVPLYHHIIGEKFRVFILHPDITVNILSLYLGIIARRAGRRNIPLRGVQSANNSQHPGYSYGFTPTNLFRRGALCCTV
jgi:hypothetical protein